MTKRQAKKLMRCFLFGPLLRHRVKTFDQAHRIDARRARRYGVQALSYYFYTPSWCRWAISSP